MKKKYCCPSFERDSNLDKSIEFNIRIIKIEVRKFLGIKKEYPYRFYQCLGYEDGEKGVSLRELHFCPFCGVKLKKRYRSDHFVNENDHSFLMIKTDKERSDGT